MRVIFLDIDGVLNCQLFYTNRPIEKRGTYPLSEICTERISWLNELCSSIGAKVVISSTWRHSGLDYCRNVLKECGASFEIIDITPTINNGVRGVEILQWIKDNEELVGLYYKYKDYVIIDDDSDMLLWQYNHFFQTDNFSGLTPTICHKIKLFFNKY